MRTELSGLHGYCVGIAKALKGPFPSFLPSFIRRFLQHQQEVLSKYLSRAVSCGVPPILSRKHKRIAQDGGMYMRVTGMPEPLVQVPVSSADHSLELVSSVRGGAFGGMLKVAQKMEFISYQYSSARVKSGAGHEADSARILADPRSQGQEVYLSFPYS